MGKAYEGWSQERIERHRAIVRESQRRRRKEWDNGRRSEEYNKSKERRKTNGYHDRRNKLVRQRARALKAECVVYKGGACKRCGIAADPCIYDFHHRDPSQKDFPISFLSGRIKDLAEVKAELDKCDLLCANCHRIEHKRED